jgi:aspartyl-tRNA synthetase
MAFPKTKSAQDLMTSAPLPVDQAALDSVGLQLKPGVGGVPPQEA